MVFRPTAAHLNAALAASSAGLAPPSYACWFPPTKYMGRWPRRWRPLWRFEGTSSGDLPTAILNPAILGFYSGKPLRIWGSQFDFRGLTALACEPAPPRVHDVVIALRCCKSKFFRVQFRKCSCSVVCGSASVPLFWVLGYWQSLFCADEQEEEVPETNQVVERCWRSVRALPRYHIINFSLCYDLRCFCLIIHGTNSLMHFCYADQLQITLQETFLMTYCRNLSGNTCFSPFLLLHLID